MFSYRAKIYWAIDYFPTQLTCLKHLDCFLKLLTEFLVLAKQISLEALFLSVSGKIQHQLHKQVLSSTWGHPLYYFQMLNHCHHQRTKQVNSKTYQEPFIYDFGTLLANSSCNSTLLDYLCLLWTHSDFS
jgi:hypothetical protein